MIIELILTPIFLLIRTILGLIEGVYYLPSWIEHTISLLSKALMFFPVSVWAVLIANIAFWYVALYSWSAIEWVYKKIPGVN